MSLQVLELKPSTEETLWSAFLNLPKSARVPEYQANLPPVEQTRRLVQWGINNGSRFWVVLDNERAILRLSARVSPQYKNTGTLGFFEMDTQANSSQEGFRLILEAALSWLRSEGVYKVVAPIDLNTWFNYRFSTVGKKFFPRFSWEPTTPPEYEEMFKQHGFSDLAYFHTVFFPHFRVGSFCVGTGPMKRSYKRIIESGFTLRPFDMENFSSKELPLFHEISHEAFSDSLMFEPIDLETFRNLYASAVQKYDFSPSSVLISPEGETAGFIFAFYDGNYLVIKSIAIKRKFQGMRLSSGMIFNAVRQSWDQGKTGTISALVRTGLASERIEKNVKRTMWFSWSHYYSLLQKELE